MARLPRKIACPTDKAEGRCDGVPYNTELVNSDGVSIHFWLGDETPTDERLAALRLTASRHRDVVGATYSDGEPIGFWANQNMGKEPSAMPKQPYCRPANAGLASEPRAVCRRIGRLLDSLGNEVNNFVVEGQIAQDIRDFRYQLIQRLRADGWTMSYDGGDRMKVREPGHKRPFKVPA